MEILFFTKEQKEKSFITIKWQFTKTKTGYILPLEALLDDDNNLSVFSKKEFNEEDKIKIKLN